MGKNMTETNYQKIYNKLIKRFIISSLLLITIFIVKQFFIQYQITQEENISYVINVVGRQRMLSQKIVKNILHIQNDTNPIEVQYYIENLEENFELWEKSHYELVNSDETQGILHNNSNAIFQMFQDLEPTFLSLADNTKSILKLKESNLDSNQLNAKIKEINKKETIYLDKMDTIVYQYEYEVGQAIGDIKTIHIVLFSVIICIFLFITIMIIIPVLKNLKNAFLKVNVSINNLSKMFHTMKGAIFVVKFDGEILLMNADAEKITYHENLQDDVLYLTQHINWLEFDIMQVIEKAKNNDCRVENIETKIEDREGKVLSVMLSAVSANYKGCETVMVTLFDITIQKKAQEVLKNMATKDELTGLYNRYFLDSIIDEEIDRAERYEIPLAAVLLDLDYFKKVNDQWGHPMGDNVLQFTAEIIKKNTRLSDYAFRIGGEEFLILMLNTNSKGAVIAAEKMRKVIEDATHPVVGKFTSSFGVAERNVGENYQSLYKRVDKALYEAKEAGRNRVVKAQSIKDEDASVSLTWNKRWNCGEEIIDEQHRALFRIVSQFANSFYSLEDKENALNYLNDIIKKLILHFEYEEKVLFEVSYENLIRHKKIHRELLNKVQERKDAVETETMESIKAFSFIFDEIIIGHLLCEDILFYSCFKQRNYSI
jgi:diguanylate cyclase (GGDEF)-like protein/hemerythrin-like metal-binding protein/PAS domain S-box-containing protein